MNFAVYLNLVVYNFNFPVEAAFVLKLRMSYKAKRNPIDESIGN